MLPNIGEGNIVLSTIDFLPELTLCAAVVFLLILRLFRIFDRTHLGSIALLFSLVALVMSVYQWLGGYPLVPESTARENLEKLRSGVLIFGGSAGGRESGLLFYDHFTVFLRCFLYGFTALV